MLVYRGYLYVFIILLLFHDDDWLIYVKMCNNCVSDIMIIDTDHWQCCCWWWWGGGWWWWCWWWWCCCCCWCWCWWCHTSQWISDEAPRQTRNHWRELRPKTIVQEVQGQMSLTGWWFGTFFHILGIIIPTDFHIFQRGRSTTNQLMIWDRKRPVVFGHGRWFVARWYLMVNGTAKSQQNMWSSWVMESRQGQLVPSGKLT